MTTIFFEFCMPHGHKDERRFTIIEGFHFELDCSGAMKCFKTHWNLNKSILDVPRTNICAERAIKLMKELQHKCKIYKYLCLTFIATNKF